MESTSGRCLSLSGCPNPLPLSNAWQLSSKPKRYIGSRKLRRDRTGASNPFREMSLSSEFRDGLVQSCHGDGFDDAGTRDAGGLFGLVPRPDPAVAVFCGADDGQGFVV